MAEAKEDTTPGAGHNTGGIAGDRLRSIIERWERLEDEKKALASDQKDVMTEAKSSGLDVAVIRAIIRERKMDEEERDEREHLMDLYKRALGMLADLPLGAAAIERAGA